MRTVRLMRFAGAVAAGTIVVLLAGCQVETNQRGNGKDVNISTPFGGMQVRTNDADVLAGIGLPAYPGATLVKDDNDKNSSADINMSFGGYSLRVKAAAYRTNDSPAKVEAFYREGLRRYGVVIACRNYQPVGLPARTPEGLTCALDLDGHQSGDDDMGKSELELKAGSTTHQHLVTIDADGSGTKIGMVALDLPMKMDSDGGSDDTRQ